MSKKFVTMCEGGVVRSVAMALVLKQRGQDAIAVSWRWNAPITRHKMFEWADVIVIMEPHFIEHIPAEFHNKTRTVDVGPDTYGNPLHSGLCTFISGIVDNWERRAWSI